MTFKTITIEQHEDIAVLLLNRPDKLNAFTFLMMEELISALDVMITTKKLNPAKTFFWIDIFSISQHVAHQNQVDENNDVEIKTRDAIRNVEGVILILS